MSYNRETTFESAIYFNSKESLISILRRIDETSSLNKISIKMKQIADEHYGWKKITDKYAEIF